MDNTTSYKADHTGAEGLSMYEVWYPWMASVNTILITSGIPGNLLTIAAYWKYESLWTPTNALIVSQSVGDLFTCLTTPMLVFFHYTLVGQRVASLYRYACLTGLLTAIIAIESSATNLLALSIERFIAVYFSLEYYNWVTDHSVKMVVTGIWCFVLLSNSLPLFGLNTWQVGTSCWPLYVYNHAQFVASFVVPLAVCLLGIAVFSILVACAAMKKERDYDAAVPAAAAANQLSEEAANRKKQQKIEFRITKMLFMVVGTFYACWLPSLLTYVLRLTLWGDQDYPTITEPLSEFFRGLIGFNAFLNPFIYAHKSPAFRRAFCKLLKIKLKNTDTFSRRTASSQIKSVSKDFTVKCG